MPKYQIVIHDAAKALAFEKRQYEAAFVSVGVSPTKAATLASARVGEARKPGTVHTEMGDECPEGLPNCRNCGDPTYADSCKAAGHCPDCGTKHGIAPDSVLVRHGLALKAV